MNLIVYTPMNDRSSDRLMSRAVALAKVECKKIFHSFKQFKEKIRRQRFDATIIILNITSNDEMSSAFSIKDYLMGRQLILILPDSNYETVSKGHQLCPRYVTYVNSDFSDVCAVVDKMVLNSRYKERQQWNEWGEKDPANIGDCR